MSQSCSSSLFLLWFATQIKSQEKFVLFIEFSTCKLKYSDSEYCCLDNRLISESCSLVTDNIK